MMLVGFGLSGIFKLLNLPGLIGMILASILFGSYALDLIAPNLLNISIQDAAILGYVLAIVSPSVVVLRMLQLIYQGYGHKNTIPQLIMVGAIGIDYLSSKQLVKDKTSHNKSQT
jgi:hypothetical protein